MAAVPDIYKNVNISDGQVIVTADMNGLVRYQQAKLTDQVIEKLIAGLVGTISADTPDVDFPGSMNGTDVPTSLAFALNCGGACPSQGTTNAKLKITPGTLFQKIGAASGSDSTLLAFTFDGTEFVTIANGDPSNPRIDIVEMKLELIDTLDTASRDVEDAVTDAPSSQTVNTTHRVQMTLQVKAGTPAATPTFPAVDAGFVPICAVMVGANYVAAAGFKFDDTAGATATIWDMRMPINVQVFRVHPTAFMFDTGASKWALSSTRDNVTAGSVAADLIVPCPVTKGRILAVSISNLNGTGSDAHLSTVSDNGITTNAAMANLRGLPTAPGPAKEQQNTFRYWNPAVIAGALPATNYGTANIPVWANGRRTPAETFKLGSGGDGITADVGKYTALVVKNGPLTMAVTSVRFFVAVGL